MYFAVKEVQSAWIRLSDNFKKAWKHNKNIKSGSSGTTITCDYYEQLMFLIETIEHRPTKSTSIWNKRNNSSMDNIAQSTKKVPKWDEGAIKQKNLLQSETNNLLEIKKEVSHVKEQLVEALKPSANDAIHNIFYDNFEHVPKHKRQDCLGHLLSFLKNYQN